MGIILNLPWLHSARCLLTCRCPYCSCVIVLCVKLLYSGDFVFDQHMSFYTWDKLLYKRHLYFYMKSKILSSTFCPLLSFMESPVIIRSHVPHRGSLHLETDGLGLLVENSAFVNKRFRFCGCRRLIIIFVSSSRFFISGEFERNFKLSFAMPTTCELLGLCVMTKGRVLFS